MSAKDLETEIDRLYQLPLTEFTAARNALAKELSGDAAQRVKSLAKPSLPAWIVNQLYWRKRPTYDALIRAAERLRSAHRALLEGRKVDLKAADAAHHAALNKALHDVEAVATKTSTGPVLEGVTLTLQALPASNTPGRLEKPLKPSGFEILAGLTTRAVRRSLSEKPTARPSKSSKEAEQDAAEARRKAAAARAALRQAEAKHRAAVAAVEKHSKHLAEARRKEHQLSEALEQTARQREELEKEGEALEKTAQEAADAVTEAQRRVG